MILTNGGGLDDNGAMIFGLSKIGLLIKSLTGFLDFGREPSQFINFSASGGLVSYKKKRVFAETLFGCVLGREYVSVGECVSVGGATDSCPK